MRYRQNLIQTIAGHEATASIYEDDINEAELRRINDVEGFTVYKPGTRDSWVKIESLHLTPEQLEQAIGRARDLHRAGFLLEA